MFLVLEYMRFALECQPDGLETGRNQADYYPDLFASQCQSKNRATSRWGVGSLNHTATLLWGDRSPRFPMVEYPDALVAKRGREENDRA